MSMDIEAVIDTRSERELAGLCVALGAASVPGWSEQEQALAAAACAPGRRRLAATREAIEAGADPLGDAFCALRSPAARRAQGATYTPAAAIRAMTEWARASIQPQRIVDPGAGSGRFLVAAGRGFPGARLVGVEIDPLAALMARAHLAAAGLSARASVMVADYRVAALAAGRGPTLFLGNPPYVRHHHIDARWKRWLADTAAAHDLRASRLAGLHVHFFLATLAHARAGDAGCFITAAEWLDVGYGRLVRELLAGPLGGLRLDILDPATPVFADAHTTAAIACFRVGAAPASLRVRRVAAVDELAPLRGGRRVERARMATVSRWSSLWRPARRARPQGLMELGELCRVHRGQATGANQVWIAGAHTPPLPRSVLFPAVTRARELFAAGAALADLASLRRVIDLPAAMETLPPDDREAIERFLAWAQERGAHLTYLARHRSPWWSVKLREPPPILATYMARRPPAFVRNRAGARFLNIAHGLYPREAMSEACLDALAGYLASAVDLEQGRTYAGGLTKFEPREMERLLVPAPDALARSARVPCADAPAT